MALIPRPWPSLALLHPLWTHSAPIHVLALAAAVAADKLPLGSVAVESNAVAVVVAVRMLLWLLAA